MGTGLMAGWDGLLRLLRRSSQLVLVFMTVTICYDAVMRYVFLTPTRWSLEINTFLIVYLGIMAAAEVQRQDQHIRITFFVERMPPRLQRLSRVLTGVAGAAFCAVLAWRGGILAYQSWVSGERVSSAFGTPMVLPYAIIPIGFGVLGLQFLLDTLTAGRSRTGSGSDASPPSRSGAASRPTEEVDHA